MPTEDELFNRILERYELDEFLELSGLTLRDILTIWDGWISHPDILEDLGFVEEETDDDESDG